MSHGGGHKRVGPPPEPWSHKKCFIVYGILFYLCAVMVTNVIYIWRYEIW